MIPLVYSPKYNITLFGLERRHPFDGRKYARIHDWLIRQGMRKAADFVTPRPCTQAALREVHSRAYLRSLRDRRVLARLFEVPALRYLPAWLLDWRIMAPKRWATGGTILACRLALERGLAINLGGGFHHAAPERGAGFCAYADVPLSLHTLHQEGRFTSALVVDTDAHQGDGTADALRSWPWAHLVDLFEQELFPFLKAAEEMPVPLPPRTNGVGYMEALREHLPKALDRFRPDLVVYNAGSDVLASDPLSNFVLTADDLAERDLHVTTEVREREIPLAMVLSGGYGPVSWQAHASSIEGILTRFDRTV